jgi:hypothetical protein
MPGERPARLDVPFGRRRQPEGEFVATRRLAPTFARCIIIVLRPAVRDLVVLWLVYYFFIQIQLDVYLSSLYWLLSDLRGRWFKQSL